MKKKWLLVLMVFLFLQKINGQVIHINDLDSVWHFKVSATGSYSDGNLPRSLLTNKLKLTKVNDLFGLISNFTYQYGTASSKKIIVYNDFRFENTLLLKPKNFFCPFVRTFSEKNIIRKIKFRHEIALGILRKIISSKKQGINILVAGVNQQTNYNTNSFNIIEYNGSENKNTWKAMAGVSGMNSIVKNKLQAEYRFYWMQAFDEPKNYAYFIDVSLEFMLNNHFKLQANYVKTFENLEPIGVLPYEIQLTYGLSVTF